MFRRFLSFLLSRLGVVVTPNQANSGSISTRFIVDVNGSNKTFKLDGGSMLNSSTVVNRIDLSPADLENLVHLSQRADPGKTTLLVATRPLAFLQLEVDGKKQVYDTISGISNDAKQQMAQQLGITIEQLDTLLKVERQALGQVLGNNNQPPINDQAGKIAVLRPDEKHQLVICPGCARQIPLAEHCLYCGEQLEGKTAPPIE